MLDRGLGRRLDMFDVPLDDMRRAAKATNGSVNDVFVAAVVGGLRRYHERHGAARERAAHDAADQPAHRAATTPAATSSRRRASRCPAAIDDPAERDARRSARSCASGAPSPRCS